MRLSMTPQADSAITGLILCGGEGRRMGGIDKGLAPFHGKPLVDIAIERLKPQVADIVLSANRNLRDYESRGYQVLKDEELRHDGPGYEGPLAGILSGMRSCRSPWLMVVPCDAPMFPLDLVAQLQSCLSADCTAAHVDGHPTFALISTQHLHELERFLQHGQRKLGAFLSQIGAALLPVRVPSDFRNLNSPQDLAPEARL